MLGMGGFSSDQNTRTITTEHTSTATLTSGTGVFGAYAQLIASTGITYNYLTILFDDPNTSNDYDITIAIGAAASELDVIDELTYHIDLTGNNTISLSYNIKLRIAKGSRIAAKVKATNNTDTIDVHIIGQGF